MMPTHEDFARLVLERLTLLETKLAAKKHPRLSDWWSSLLRRFMSTPAKQLVVRAGRRAGKSSSACMFAVAFALVYASLGLVPPADVGWVVFVSVSKEEAASRLRAIKAILKAIGAKHVVDGDTILLAGVNIGFRVQACTVGAASGWTSILIIADEVAKWRNADDGANPAEEVLAALRPGMATLPLARILLLSSPLGTLDAHAIAFDVGDSEFQITAFAPTWIGKPTISEAATHKLEPDLRIWRREYAAIPQSGAAVVFLPSEIERAFEARPAPARRGRRVLVIDASSGRKDTWSWGIVGRNANQDGSEYVALDMADGVDGAEVIARGIKAGDIVDRVVAVASANDICEVHADQREAFALASLFADREFTYVHHDWTAASKPAGVETLRRWFREGTIALPQHETLRRELLIFEERITASGAFTFGARGSGHDDYCSLLITAALTEISGELPPVREEPRTACPAPVTLTNPPWAELGINIGGGHDTYLDPSIMQIVSGMGGGGNGNGNRGNGQ